MTVENISKKGAVAKYNLGETVRSIMQACSVLGRLAFALRIYFLQMAHDTSEAAFPQIQMSNQVALPRSAHAQTLAALLYLNIARFANAVHVTICL